MAAYGGYPAEEAAGIDMGGFMDEGEAHPPQYHAARPPPPQQPMAGFYDPTRYGAHTRSLCLCLSLSHAVSLSRCLVSLSLTQWFAVLQMKPRLLRLTRTTRRRRQARPSGGRAPLQPAAADAVGCHPQGSTPAPTPTPPPPPTTAEASLRPFLSQVWPGRLERHLRHGVTPRGAQTTSS